MKEGTVIKSRSNAYRLSLLSLFIAIVLVQSVVPFFGYIPVGPFSLSIIQITVVVTAVVLGPKEGALVGFVWGLVNWIRAFVWPTSPLAIYVLVNPLISVLPRVLVGVFAGIVYWQLKKKTSKIWPMAFAGVVGAMTNTVLVLGGMWGLYTLGWLPLDRLNISALMPYLLGIMGTNGIPEAIFTAIVVPLIAHPLSRLTAKK